MDAPVEKDSLPSRSCSSRHRFRAHWFWAVSNAFGAGIPAGRPGLRGDPKIITCTSGHRSYGPSATLEALAAKKADQRWKSWRSQLQKEIDLVSPWPPSLDLMNKWKPWRSTAFPTSSKPAIVEYWLRPFRKLPYELVFGSDQYYSGPDLAVPALCSFENSGRLPGDRQGSER